MVSSRSETTTFIRSVGAIGTWIIIAAVLCAVLLGFASRGVSEPRTDDAPDTGFSAVRAGEAAAPLVAKPRPVGSIENASTREQLADRLQGLGFDTGVHEATGARTVPAEEETESRVGFTRNLIATRHGSNPTGTVVLATHIDSVNGAPGAADAGIGLSVILESLRALGDDAHRNDIAVVLVDGEEDLMLGSKALMESGELKLADPVVVLNHEARGTSGRPVVTRWNGPMHTVLPRMPDPEAESFTDALFEFLPNDTDFTEYRKAGWWGMDMAITGDSWAYHTPQDDLAHLDKSTLQHYGDMTLTLTRDLADTDMGALDEESTSPVLMTAPWGIAALSPLILRLLAVAGVVAVVAGAVIAHRRRLITGGSVLLGAVAGVATLVVGAGLAVAMWAGASAMKPAMLSVVMSEPFRSWPFFLAEVAVALGAVWLGWSLMRRWLSSLAVGLGWSVCAAVLVGAFTVFSPGLGGWLLLPVAIASLGLLASILLTVFAQRSLRRRVLLVVTAIVTTVPMGWVFGAQFSALREFGIASSNGMLAGVVVLTIFAIAPVLMVRAGAGADAGADLGEGAEAGADAGVEVGADEGADEGADLGGSAGADPDAEVAVGGSIFAPAEGPLSAGDGPSAAAEGPSAAPSFARRLVVPAGFLVVAIALSGVGIWSNANSDEPVQERVTAEVDADKATTTWKASGTTQWGRGINGTTGDAGGLQAPRCVRAEEADATAKGDPRSGHSGGGDSGGGASGGSDSGEKNSGQRVTITVSSPSNAARMSIEPVKGTVRDIVVDGTDVPGPEGSGSRAGESRESGESGEPAGSTRLMLSGLEAGQKTTVSFTPSAEVTALECSEETDDLSIAPGWKAPPPGSVSLVQPVVRVTKTLTL